MTPAVAVASNEVGATPVVKLVEVGRLPSGLDSQQKSLKQDCWRCRPNSCGSVHFGNSSVIIVDVLDVAAEIVFHDENIVVIATKGDIDNVLANCWYLVVHDIEETCVPVTDIAS